MSSHQLEIIMKLKDELSKRLTGIEGNLLRFSNRVKEMGTSLRAAGKMISQVGSTLALFGGIITGPLVLAFREADKYSGVVHNQLEKLKNLTATFQVQIATALVPIMEKLINILGSLFNAWNSLGPATQQMIIQGAALAGVLLTVGGGIAILVGKLISLGGIILTAAGCFGAFMAANLPLLLLVGSVLVLMQAMGELKNVGTHVCNAIQLALLSLVNGFETLKISIAKGLAFILGAAEKVLGWAAKAPGPWKKTFQSMAEGTDEVRKNLDSLANDGMANVVKNSQTMGRILTTGKGSLAEGFENVKDKVSGLWAKLKNPPPFNIKPITERLISLEEISRRVFQSMEQNLSDFFYNSFTEKTFKIQDFFRQMGQNILRIWTDLLAKMLSKWIQSMITMQSFGGGSSGSGFLGTLASIVGTIFGGPIGGAVGGIIGGVGGSMVNTGAQSIAGHSFTTAWSPYHTGGPILNRLVRAHNGLAIDEVPIIAKRGEYMLSERGVAAAGGVGNLNRINRGEPVNGGMTINVSFPITAVDTQTGAEFLHRHAQEIAGIVAEKIRKNSGLRSTITNYCN